MIHDVHVWKHDVHVKALYEHKMIYAYISSKANKTGGGSVVAQMTPFLRQICSDTIEGLMYFIPHGGGMFNNCLYELGFPDWMAPAYTSSDIEFKSYNGQNNVLNKKIK